MKKIIVEKVIQKEITFYVMVADPRMIAKARRKYTAGEKQDVQRPWVEKKVQDIAKYVAGNSSIEGKRSLGIIPNAPIINVKGKLRVQHETVSVTIDGIQTTKEQSFIMFPETDSEIANYENSLEIIDGQHRVIAFDNDFLDPDFKTGAPYEMIFSVFDNITDNQRKELFMVTNEKQDKVETNLLRYIKKSLGLLEGEDEVIYDLLDALNRESSSPLYGRIMFGSDKFAKGYKENQVSKIFKQYGVKKFYDTVISTRPEHRGDSVSVFVAVVGNYLSAWEECCNVSFRSPGSDTITKISGLRYLFYVFPDICNKLISKGEKLTKENFKKIVNDFPEALGVENVKCVFCDDEAEGQSDENRGYSFRGEGATIALAKNDIQKVMTFENTVPIGGLI